MQSYKSVTGKIFNQAPYDPKLYKYINVPKVTFDRSKPKKQEISQNVEQVQGKIFNQAPYNPKLNRFNITPQNYKTQEAKVNADIALKKELTNRVTESNTGDMMRLDKKRRDYAPLLETLASAGIVVSQAINSPKDMSEAIKNMLTNITKTEPRSKWASSIPESLKKLAVSIMENIKTGTIAPADVPLIIHDIENDPALDIPVEIPPELVEPEVDPNDILGSLRTVYKLQLKNAFDRANTAEDINAVIENSFDAFLNSEYADDIKTVLAGLGMDVEQTLIDEYQAALINEADTISSEVKRDATKQLIYEQFGIEDLPPPAPLARDDIRQAIEQPIVALATLMEQQFTDVFNRSEFYPEFVRNVRDASTIIRNSPEFVEASRALTDQDILTITSAALTEVAQKKTKVSQKTKLKWINDWLTNEPDADLENQDEVNALDELPPIVQQPEVLTEPETVEEELALQSEIAPEGSVPIPEPPKQKETKQVKKNTTSLSVTSSGRIVQTLQPGDYEFTAGQIQGDRLFFRNAEGDIEERAITRDSLEKVINPQTKEDKSTMKGLRDKLLKSVLYPFGWIEPIFLRDAPDTRLVKHTDDGNNLIDVINDVEFKRTLIGQSLTFVARSKKGKGNFRGKKFTMHRDLYLYFLFVDAYPDKPVPSFDPRTLVIALNSLPGIHDDYESFKLMMEHAKAFDTPVVQQLYQIGGAKKMKAYKPRLSPDGSIKQHGNLFYDTKTDALKAILLPSKQLKVTLSIGDPKVDGKVAVIPDKIDPKDLAAIFNTKPAAKRKKLTQMQEDILTLIQVSNLEKPDKYASTPVTHSKKQEGPPAEITPELFNEIVSQLDKHLNGGAISKQQYLKVMRSLEHA